MTDTRAAKRYYSCLIGINTAVDVARRVNISLDERPYEANHRRDFANYFGTSSSSSSAGPTLSDSFSVRTLAEEFEFGETFRKHTRRTDGRTASGLFVLTARRK